MVKVLVFETYKEAEKELRQHIYRNKLTLSGMCSKIQAMESVYRKSAEFRKLHGDKNNAPLNPHEIHSLQTLAGKGEVFISLLKLYAQGSQEYYVDRSFTELEFGGSIYQGGPYKSIDELADMIKEQIDKQNLDFLKANHELRIDSLFYTVRESYTYSEMQKRTIRNMAELQGLSPEKRATLEQNLKKYLEWGLAEKEIQMFEKRWWQSVN